MWLMRLRKMALVSAAVGVLGAGAVYSYQAGAVSAARDALVEKMVDVSALSGFRVQQVLVRGRARIPQEDLLMHLNIDDNAPIFDIDLAKARENIAEIPWIKDVAVSRQLPDTVIVSITERTPVALWQYQKKISAIDADGVALTSDGLEQFRQLPLVVGAEAPARATEIVALLTAEPTIAAQFQSAVRIGDRRWDLKLKNGITVKLPENDVELAISRLARGQQTKDLLGKNITTIDLRIPDKLVVETAAAMPDKKTSI
jgi:cell division protein FtsQ